MRKKLSIIAATALVSVILPANQAVSCGRDFFVCDPASLPEGGASLFLPTFNWERHNADDEFELSLGLVHPLTKRIAFDAYTSFADEGDGWEIETLTPGFLFDLSPDLENSPVRVGLFTACKFALNGADDEDFISANQLDARDQFESRVIIETDLTERTGLVFNLLSTVYDDKARWGYAAGLRHEFREGLGGSLEFIGDFQQQGKHEVFANVWWEPTEGIVLRAGVGAGLSERAEDFTLLTGLIFEFS